MRVHGFGRSIIECPSGEIVEAEGAELQSWASEAGTGGRVSHVENF